MSLAYFCLAAVFVAPGRLERGIRWLFISLLPRRRGPQILST